MITGYEFVGVLNLFNIYPDFLFPIYQKGKELFFHNGKKNRIYNFDCITESVRDKIIFLDSNKEKIINNSKKDYYFEHDTPVYAFQENDKKIFCADLGDMILYLTSIDTEDDILKRQIKRFISENILEYYINTLCSVSPKATFFQHHCRPLIDTNNELGEMMISNLAGKNQIKYNILSNIVSQYDESEDIVNYKLIPGEQSYMHRYGIQGDLGVCLRERLNELSNYARLYNISHEMYHMDYCACRLNNIHTISADFVKIKRDFDRIIKKISYSSSAYDVCIKCQNAIINKDENELILLINKNRQFFAMLQRSGMLEDYLEQYIQSHIYEVTFEFL